MVEAEVANFTNNDKSSGASDRIEKDSMGELAIPAHTYYGIQTLRAVQNFPISGLQPLPTYIDACLLIKKATAIANQELGCIPADIGAAIVQATNEILSGSLRDQFVVDVYECQRGARQPCPRDIGRQQGQL
jgi:aspartate ammonia-lyase